MQWTSRSYVGGLILTTLLSLHPLTTRSAGAQEPTPPGEGTVSIEQPVAVDSLDQVNPLLHTGKFAEAEALIRRILERNEAEFGPSSAQVGRILDNLVVCLWQSGRSQEDETIQLANRAVEIKKAIYGPVHPEVATSLFSTGVIRAIGDDYEGAEPIFERVLEIREATLPPDHHEIASSINALANIRFSRSDFSGSLPLYQRSLELAEGKGGPLHPVAKSIRGNLASNFEKLGDYKEAQQILEYQIELHETEGLEDEDLGFAYSLLANIYTSLGDFEEEVRLRERSLEIRTAFFGEEHPRTAQTLLNMGNNLWHLGQFAEARELIERGRAIWEQTYDAEHAHITAFHEGLGRLAYEEGNLEESKKHHEFVLRVREEKLGEDHPKVAEALRSLGRIAMREGRHAQARAHLERALAIVTDKIGIDHTLAADYGINLAHAEFLSGEYDAAAQHALEAERVSREHLRLTSRALPERQALRYAGSRAAGLDLLATILEKGVDPALTAQVWDAMIRSRAVIFDEMAARGRDLAWAEDPVIGERIETYRVASTRLANLYVRGPEDNDAETYRATLESARLAMEDAERDLTDARGSRGSDLAVADIGWEEVKQSLPSGSAIVGYAFYRHTPAEFTGADAGDFAYSAFVLPPGASSPILVDLGSAATIDARIVGWKDEVSFGALRSDRDPADAIDAYRTAASALRESIWDPLARHLEGAQRIFVVPDGQIHLVNLATLPDEGDGYLIETDWTFHHLSAEREIARGRFEGSRGNGALVLGAPDFDEVGSESAPPRVLFRGERPDCAGFRSLRFEPLPGSFEEAKNVAELWQSHFDELESRKDGAARVQLLTGGQATETAIKQMAPGRRILHIATHGYFLNSACPSGFGGTRGIGLLVSDEKARDDGRDLQAVQNPLLLSGLALAGVNLRESTEADSDDGILTAQEIATLDLSGVEWAVLSACETGVGKVLNGEGVFGLQRAFRVAGARTLITSLWSVKDEETRDWMDAFYRASLEQEFETIDAVREAGRTVLQKHRESGASTHPFYWGAFIASGDWR